MPKIVDYPRASLTNSIELANAVYELGGHSTIHTCADKMNKSVSGAFKAIVSGADKFGLIDNKRGELSCTDLFNKYKHAYSEEEENSLLQKAFLSSSVFLSVYERFRGRSVPAKILDRILVREFEVAPPVASRVSGYFINGGKEVGLIDESNTVIHLDQDKEEPEDTSKKAAELEKENSVLESSDKTSIQIPSSPQEIIPETVPLDTYSVQFHGPGLNTTIEISEEQDLHIIDAIIAMIKKKKNISGGNVS